jgi:hypothetical protein
MTEDYKSKLEEMSRLYLEKLCLEATSEYWREVAKQEAARSTKFQLISVSLLAVGILCFSIYLLQGLSGLPRDATGVPVLAGLAVVTLPAVMFFWVVRIFTRAQNRHAQLADDARLREVMVSTYLALAKDNPEEAKPEQRLLVLQALFRPYQAAGSEPEPQPSSLVEVLLQTVAGKAPTAK